MRSLEVWMRSLVFGCACCGLVAVAGCGLWPQLGPPPRVGPGYIPTSGEEAAATEPTTVPADTLAAEPVEPTPPTASSPSGTPPPRRRTPQAAAPPAAPVDTTGIAGESAPADTAATAGPPLQVEISSGDRQKLAATARSDIGRAEAVAQRAALRPLGSRDRDKIETALGLIRQAREALDREDVPAAANLAYKAKLLAEEVAD